MKPAPYALVLLSIVSPMTGAEASAQDGTQAEKVFYTGEEQGDLVHVPPEVDSRHPGFLANRNVRVDGRVGDLFAAGQTVQVSGVVDGNAFVGCQRVHVEGRITGDLFFAGETALIDGQIEGDLYGFFNEVRILDGGSVGGDLHVGGEAIWVEGAVGGRIVGAAQRVDIMGAVGEDVLVAAESLFVHETARIGGDVRYDTKDEPTIRDGATIGGAVERVSYQREIEEIERHHQGTGFLERLFWKLWLFLSTVIVGILFLALGGAGASRPAEALAATPGKGLGIGFVVSMVVPITSLLAVIACLTLPLGLIGMTVFLLAAYLARIVTAQCVGMWVLRKLGSSASLPIPGLLIGLVIFYALTSIPFLGDLIWYAWVISGLGGIALALPRKKSESIEG